MSTGELRAQAAAKEGGEQGPATGVAPRRWRRHTRRILRWAGGLLALFIVVLVALPIGRYLIRAAWQEAKILARRRPIERLMADSATDARTRRQLRLVLDARDFAQTRLGLAVGESFSTYSKLERDTLVLVLSAAPRDRLEAHTWWFPVVGRVPYKGFFDFGAAMRAREDLQRRGFDTYLRPASAFSTLGWFNDPLLSTTLFQDSLSLVNTVIHELTHNTIFVSSKIAFNESFASFVGARGAALFFQARGSPRAARFVLREWEDEKLLSSFWLATSVAIDSALTAHPDDSTRRVLARDTVYARLRRVLLEDLSPRMPTISRKGLERMQLDNASLLAHKVYGSDLWLFDEVHRRLGGDLRRTVVDVAKIVRGADDPFEALRTWMSTSSHPG